MLVHQKYFSPIYNGRKNNISFSSNAKYIKDYDKYIMYKLHKIAELNKQNIELEKIRKIPNSYPLHNIKNYTGCLIGGAVGDALGNPVEFYSLQSINQIYGDSGIVDMELINGKAEITDDTQMTIFTADGLLKSYLKFLNTDELPDMNLVYKSYQDWYKTQYKAYHPTENGWLSNISDLYSQRSPGLTCTGALRYGVPGSIESPINNSRGCGGVMRTAPAGLMYYKNPKLAFEVGARCAALTHSSPDAYLPAGFHSAVIANIIGGDDIETSIDKSIEILKQYKNHQNVLSLIEKAKAFAKSNIDSEVAIKNLGEGWDGDEALAISIYCILKSPDNFEKAVIMAVNHDGDSDSTGAITGNIMGASLGIDKIPSRWKNKVELKPLLLQLAKDLYVKPEEIEDSKNRYPSF